MAPLKRSRSGGASPPGSGGGTAPPGGWRETAIVLGLLALFLISQYGRYLDAPFINDDYIFLDKTRAASFLSLWAPKDLLFHYYRPWSRELHFAVLQGLFGAREMPFHVASFGLWLVVMGVWFVTARRLAGSLAATVAVACTAALGGWTVPILWASGAQELWLLLFSMLFLLAVAAGRTPGALAALTLALLSKETAVVLPAIAMLQLRVLHRARWGEALRWTAPLWALLATWALLHPLLGGQLWRPIHEPVPPGVHPSALAILASTLGSLFNLTPWPRPESGWTPALGLALSGAALLAGLVAWGSRARRRLPARNMPPGGPSVREIAIFGCGWALLAWLPLGLPSIAWRSHYALLGAFGAWLAIAAWLAPRSSAALTVVAALVVLRAAVADTPTRDWSSEWYRRRAGDFVAHLRADLLAKLPRPAPHSRMYFVRVPSDVGFLAGDGPAIRVWYRDSTLSGGFYSSYRMREPTAPPGDDLFFRFDSTSGWMRIVQGPENETAARRLNPRWVLDHQTLAQTLVRADDWAAASHEYEKLARAESLNVDFAYNAGVSREALGDSARAAYWFGRAAALPGAGDEIRAAAGQYRHLLAPPGSPRQSTGGERRTGR